MSFAEKAGAKIAVGPKIRMTFADGRESICNLQAEINFTIGETKSTATFRIVTKLLPGIEVILGKPWLKAAKPSVDFETGSVYVNRRHALGPKLEPSPLTENPPVTAPAATAQAKTVATAAMPLLKDQTAAPQAFQQIAETPPAAVHIEPKVEPPAVQVSVIGAKQMHKTLKGENEVTALLFVGAAEAQAVAGETPPIHPALKGLVSQFQDSVLTSELKKGVPNSKLTHKIELIDGSEVPGQRPFRLSQSEATEISKQLTEQIDLGLIRPSLSGFGAPILLVKKKDGTFRMCIDYRRLNAITKKDSFPLPLIDDLVDKLTGAKVFSKIDLKSGFHQVKMDPSSIERTTFVTPSGSYEWLVMPMGLANAPATFQRLMQKTLGHLKFVGIYLDDIVIFSANMEEHKQHLQAVLEILKKDGLIANASKCMFGSSEVTFCGFVIANGTIKMESSKVEAVRTWTEPKTISELRGFLGFINFYRKFLRQIGGIAAPLTALLGQRRGSTALVLTAAVQQQAFVQLKSLVTSEPVLLQFDPALPTALFTDSSDTQAGSFVAQDHGKGWIPIAFESHKLSPAETGYDIRDKELLAVTLACKKFRHWLVGKPVKVFTDHESLSSLLKGSNVMPSDRVARQIEFLAGFNLEICYLEGSKNVVADALSRLPSAALDNAKVEAAALSATVPVKKNWMEILKQDKYFGPIINTIVTGTSSAKLLKRASFFKLTETQLFFAPDSEPPRVCVPKKLQLEIMRMGHDEPSGGHLGVTKTQLSLQRTHFWPKMLQDIKSYVVSCRSCQSCKPNLHPAVVAPQPIIPPPTRGHTVAMDFITSLPKTLTGYDAILTVTDILTDRVTLIKTKTTATAEDTAQLFVEHVFCKVGMPLVTISDRDPKFTSEFWQSMMKKLGTKTNMSTADYAQADGRSEKTNQTMITICRQMVSYNQSNWDEVLPLIEFAINSHQSEGTGVTPFMADMGREPRQPLNLEIPTVTDDSSFASKIKTVIQQAQALDTTRNEQRHARFLATRRLSKPFQLGARVWVKASALRDPTSADAGKKKLQPLFVGPFPITKIMGPATYKIELPPHIKGHNVLNVSKLKLHHENEIEGRHAKPPGAAGKDYSGNDLFTMQKILDMKFLRNKKYYLIEWTGYEQESTWEPASGIMKDAESQKVVQDFLHSYQPPRSGRAARQRRGAV